MAVKHIVTMGFTFADGTHYIVTEGFDSAVVVPSSKRYLDTRPHVSYDSIGSEKLRGPSR